MLIEDEFKTIYLNYRIKEIVPFLKKLTPKDKKEVVALLKKHMNREWEHNNISVLAGLACCKTRNDYFKLTNKISASLLSVSYVSGGVSEEIRLTYPAVLDSPIWILFGYEPDITSHYINIA